jgi:diguanylate cyclase (GGDEF)-like protein/PAS domain S-box-containing protein
MQYALFFKKSQEKAFFYLSIYKKKVSLYLIYEKEINFMLTINDWLAIIQFFFMFTTLLFLIMALIFINRSRHLRRKLSDSIETLSQKNKELEDLQTSHQNLLSPFIPETSRSIILSIDPSGKITDLNDYATEVFGYAKDELVGKNIYNTIFPNVHVKSKTKSDIISRIFTNPKLYLENETENIKKSGEHFWISWTNRVIYDDNGNPIELRSVGFDITKRKQLEEELRYLASVDPMTGSLNRQAILEAGMHELKRAQRYKRNLSVIVMKLDYFHGVDDKRGFSDDIVRQVITLCRMSIRDSDYIGRVGDVEFAILLPETKIREAQIVAERIKEKIQEENLKDEGHMFITAAFGFAEKTVASDTIDAILLRALDMLDKKEVSPKTKTIKTKKKG